MTKTSAPILTPNPARMSRTQDSSRSSHSQKSKYDQNPGAITISLALSMAWQLAIVVLLPVIIGRFIDSKVGSDALWTIIGLMIGAIGMILVVRQTLKNLNETMKIDDGKIDNGDEK